MRLQHFKNSFIFLFVMAFAVGCSNPSADTSAAEEKKAHASKIKSSGSHAELLVIVDDALWNSKAGLYLKKKIAQPFPGLPTPESLFNVIPVAPSKVTSLLKRTKSILIVEERDTSIYKVDINLWAQPQMVVYISGNQKEIAQHIKDHSNEFITAFQTQDRELIKTRMANNAYETLPKSLGAMGIKKMLLPKNLELSTDHDSVVVFWSRGVKTDQGLLVYRRPINEDVLPGQDVIEARNAVCKTYIPGVFEGSYMTTELEIPPTQSMISLGGQFAIETRGVWKTEGDKMGGPFINYTIYPENQDATITIEGWFYGPGVKKRNFMLEIEAYLQSIEF